MLRHAFPTLVSVLVLFGGGFATATDWTRFQGPSGSLPEAKGLPQTWSEKENIAWTAELPGYGQSSPVTWNGRVFVTSISGPRKEKGHVAAFALDTGKKLWQHDFATATQTESSNYVSKAAPSPVVDAGGVYCFFEGGDLLALSHDGAKLWERDLVKEFGGIESRHGLGASLEQSADRIFVWVERQAEPYLLAVDKKSGKDLWKVAGLGVTSWSSPRLVPVAGGEHLVLSGIGKLAGYDPSTGKQLWTLDEITSNSTPTPIPVGEGKFLIAATAGRGEGDSGRAAESNGLVAITKDDAGAFKAAFVWRAKRATSSFGSPLVHNGRAYFVNATGVLFCLDLATGEERYTQRLAESSWATSLAVGDRLFFFGKSGKVTLATDQDAFEKLAENTAWTSQPAAGGGPFGGPVLYAAAVVGDRLLLRRGDRLFCVASVK